MNLSTAKEELSNHVLIAAQVYDPARRMRHMYDAAMVIIRYHRVLHRDDLATLIILFERLSSPIELVEIKETDRGT